MNNTNVYNNCFGDICSHFFMTHAVCTSSVVPVDDVGGRRLTFAIYK